MIKINIILLNIWRSVFLRIWLVGSMLYSMFLVCPCCGKPACPTGLGLAALIGALFAAITTTVIKIKKLLGKFFCNIEKAKK